MLFVVVFLSLVGSTLTSSLSKRGGGHHAPLINCPTCEHHDCDFHNLMQCEVCKIVISHEYQPPKSVHCVNVGHCHGDHQTICCDNEECVESLFKPHVYGTVTNTPAIQPAGIIGCPTCHREGCDFIYRDQCFMCKIVLHDGHLPHVQCLKENEHCDPTHHNTSCCSDEQCIAQAFGLLYPTSHSTITTTKRTTSHIPTNSSTAPTTTPPHSSTLSSTTTTLPKNTSPQTNPTNTGHKTDLANQLQNYVPCPVCAHEICDSSNTIFCQACEIHFNHLQHPKDTKCLNVERCHDDNANKHICCTDMACVENVFGNIPKSGASLNGNKMYCPICTKHGCDFIFCETCVYHSHISHETQLHQFKTCEHKGECIHHNDVICCNDYQCIDKLFGTHFQSTLPTIQLTTNPSITSKTTDRASTTETHASSHATTTTIGIQNVGNSYASNALTIPTTATMTTPKAQNTATDTATPDIASFVTSNGQPSHYVSSDATSTYSTSTTTQQSTEPTTTAQSTSETNNTCVDELNNCAMFKSMGVCHASPQEGTKYDIAFQCKLTCDRCNETYQPLTTLASTIPTTTETTKAHIHCQVCGDYDNNIPCDLMSVFKGPFVACTEGAYCMNDVVHEQGNVKTFKRCVNETVCRNLWMLQSSDQDHCTNYGNVMVNGDYSCHFCCTTDRCNRGLIPDPSTYYITA